MSKCWFLIKSPPKMLLGMKEESCLFRNGFLNLAIKLYFCLLNFTAQFRSTFSQVLLSVLLLSQLLLRPISPSASMALLSSQAERIWTMQANISSLPVDSLCLFLFCQHFLWKASQQARGGRGRIYLQGRLYLGKLLNLEAIEKFSY